ncbi:MAG: hypothetical protein QUU85_04480 [Candidatus Eisenbacteria bacterium]|nr:hypothetical protein [Candidatus Eisenbacteria bacterium]
MEDDLRWAGRCLLSILRGFAWIGGTVVLGVISICRVIRFLTLLSQIRSEVIRCPRGHESPAYGVFECTSAPPVHLHEGWVFGRCAVCGLSAGWTPCVTCGLPVLDPFIRR